MLKQAPKANQKQSGWQQHPDYRIVITPCESRIRLICNGDTIAESLRTLRMEEQDHASVYYFPRDDVRMDRLQPDPKTTFCPFKGEASHWSLNDGNRHIEVAAWSYIHPFDEVQAIKDYMAFYPEVGELIE